MSKRGSILSCLKLSWAILKPSWEHLRKNLEIQPQTTQTHLGQSDFFRDGVNYDGSLFGHFLDEFVDHFLVTFWTPFGDHFGNHFRTRASKTKKATFSKKWFSRETVCIFSLLRPPKELLNPKKRDPKLTQKLTNFGPILGFKKVSKVSPKTSPKRNPK